MSDGDSITTLPAEQPYATLSAPLPSGDVPIAVAWSQGVSSINTDIWYRQNIVSNGGSGLANATSVSLNPTPNASISPAVALDANSKLQAVWDDSSTFSGNVNSSAMDQIFYQGGF